jgi:acetate CoA/acetoacetate CoA-transferase alpha subunit
VFRDRGGIVKKPVPLDKAVAMVPEGAVVMIGGFMGVGSPLRLIDEMVRQRRGNLTLISNDSARPGVGVGRLIDAGLVKRLIASHIGTNATTQHLMLEGQLEVELVP